MVKGHRIEKFESVEEFLHRIRGYGDNEIICSPHALFRLSEAQRKVFDCETLKRYLRSEAPLRCGWQYNKKYSVFYAFKGQKVIRIVLNIKPTEIEVVTFYILTKEQLVG